MITNQDSNNNKRAKEQGGDFVVRLGEPRAKKSQPSPIQPVVPIKPRVSPAGLRPRVPIRTIVRSELTATKEDDKKPIPSILPTGGDHTTPPRQTFGGLVLEVAKFTIIAFIIVTPIRYFVAQPFIVQGESMDPTFGDGQYLVINEMTYRSHDPERGDVIVFKYPRDTSKYFIKRIIGLPNETVKITNGNVTITTKDKGDIVLNEPYIKNTSFDNATETLGENEYFVMGDNRSNSLDSRSWGPVNKSHITGDVFARIFPFNLAGILPGKETE